MPCSHRHFRPVPAVKLLEIMSRNRWWPTTFHNVPKEDANGWCLNWPVWSTPHIRMSTKGCWSRNVYVVAYCQCRCGHNFCYSCGSSWSDGHVCQSREERNTPTRQASSASNLQSPSRDPHRPRFIPSNHGHWFTVLAWELWLIIFTCWLWQSLCPCTEIFWSIESHFNLVGCIGLLM